MRYLWVDAGNDADFAKAAQHGINGLYYALFDPRLTRVYLDSVRMQGYAVGVYMAWNWGQFAGKTPERVAEIVNDRVIQIMGGEGFVKPSLPKVQFDIEAHDPDSILRTLRRWRQLRPKHDTSWTMESFQGGWMTPEFVTEIVNDLRVRVVPQAYTGDMRRMSEDGTLRDLTRRGFPEALVTLFYDAAQLPVNWDGFAFTQGRLP